MLVAYVMRTGWDGPRRFAFPGNRVAFVQGTGDEVELVEDTDEEALAEVSREGTSLIIDASQAARVRVNGEPLNRPRSIGDEDEVDIGLFRYRFSTVTPSEVDRSAYLARDPTEQALLAALADDPTARVVYADWLEARDEHVRAALLRGQAAGTPTERLAALAAQTPVGWRALVAEPPIEACGVKFRFRCPKQWAALAPTALAEVRHCGACDRDVHYAISVGEARSHAQLGRCVALDITAARWRDDLDAPYDSPCRVCGHDRGRASCDHCGYTDRLMIMGQVA